MTRTPDGSWPGPAALAPFGMRVAAWAVDLVVVALLTAALVAAELWVLRDVLHLAVPPWDTTSGVRRIAIVGTAVAVVVAAYLGVGQAGPGRSLGKRLVGLRAVQVVQMPDGKLRMIQVRIRDALVRQAAHVLDLPLLWGFVRPVWDPYRRTVGDQAAHVFVVVDRNERCFAHEKYMDRDADTEPAWWLCRQRDEEIWRGAPRAEARPRDALFAAGPVQPDQRP